MDFRLANEKELDKVLLLYKNAKKEKYCVWTDDYPTIDDIKHDYKINSLYVYLIENQVVGAVSIVSPLEINNFIEWKVNKKVIEIARVVVDTNYHGLNIAVKMITNIIEIFKQKRIKAIHLACQCQNIPAIKVYQKLNFNFITKKQMYGHEYYICEYVIE